MADTFLTLRHMPVTLLIMIMMLAGSLFAFRNKEIFLNWILHPGSVITRKEYRRLLTSDLVHNDLVHLLLNEIMALYVCGQLEQFLNQKFIYGSLIFIVIYMASHFSGVFAMLWTNRNNYEYSVAGASGSILGCMMSFMILNPDYVAFYLPVIGGVKNLSAGLVVIVGLIVYQRRSGNQMMDHELHFYSAVGGLAVTIALFPQLI